MTMLPGDWLALAIMVPVLGALTYGHLRAVHLERKREQLGNTERPQ